VLPWVRGLWVDAEDSVALDAIGAEPVAPIGRDVLTVAVLRLPRISNFTDTDALTAEPGVAVRLTESPGEVAGADLVVIPGTKATVEDLRWFRSRGLDDALRARAARGNPLVGLCGGYQMLGARIVDPVESGEGDVAGLGLLPVETAFAPDKLLGNPRGTAPGFGAVAVAGYEIRHGRVRRRGGEPLFETGEGGEGCRIGTVLGTSWHGVFESDAFRRAFLRWVAAVRGLEWLPGSRPFAQVRESRLDLLGDLIERHADVDALAGLIDRGAPSWLPFVTARGTPDTIQASPLTSEPLAVRPIEPDLRVHGHRLVPPGHLDFAVNVVSDGAPTWLLEELNAAIDHVWSYPDESEAARALSERHGRAADEVLPTNGAAEAFWLLATATSPRHAVVIHPTFTEAEVALRSLGAPVERVFRRAPDFSFDLTAVPEAADLVILGNPNNPTGTLERARSIERLTRPGRVVAVDEAFMEFVPDESESLSARGDLPGLVVIRSLTKVWSIPGVRAGYILGPAELLAALRETRQPWAVNTLALTALAACARDPSAAQKVAGKVAEDREALSAALAGLPGVQVWPSAANFVLILVPDGPAVRAMLLARGIAVRRADTFPGLTPNHLRIAVRRPKENQILVEAIREALR
jgi:histidinol-phosphate/aromatic aminotransferase/cobyric acid decarboxylase-like protein